MFSNEIISQINDDYSGLVIWLTGLSSSGKTTISNELKSHFSLSNKLIYILDGDDLRNGICKDLGFDEKSRRENMRRVGEIAKLFADIGFIVIVAIIGPYRDLREKIRKKILNNNNETRRFRS